VLQNHKEHEAILDARLDDSVL